MPKKSKRLTEDELFMWAEHIAALYDNKIENPLARTVRILRKVKAGEKPTDIHAKEQARIDAYEQMLREA